MRPRTRVWWLVLVVGAVLFAAGLLIGRRFEAPGAGGARSDGSLYGAPVDSPEPSSQAPAAAVSSAENAGISGRVPPFAGDDRPLSGPATPDLAKPPMARGSSFGTIALVIDDLGRRLDVLDQLEALGVAISYSVLPFESKTPQVVRVLRGRGREMLLHLPMEAGGGEDPGPGALFVNMPRAELIRRTEAAIDAVPGATGVNNHMGSRLSADAEALRPVLETIGGRALFFLDSRTTSRSVGYALARELGIASVQRHVFLDDDRSPQALRAQFAELLRRARAQGSAIAIGHPYPETLAMLVEEVPRALDEGFRFVPVSQLVERATVAKALSGAEDS